MKPWIACALYLLLTLSTFSQPTNPVPQGPLTPTIQISNSDSGSGSDTLLCFTIPQSRMIAAELVRSQYCDSIEAACDTLVVEYEAALQVKNQQVTTLEQQVQNFLQIDSNHRQIQTELQTTLTNTHQRLKRSIWQRWLLVGGLAVTTGLLVVSP